jgi:Holliday junction resolvase RusA-like endonuclease
MRAIAVFDILGFQPAPWTVPAICVTRDGHRFTKRRGKSNLEEGRVNLKDWQRLVSDGAREAMDGRAPCRGPVKIEVTFYIRATADHVVGRPCFLALRYDEKSKGYTKPNLKGSTLPDNTNLFKGTEDAMEGIVYQDDFQVVEEISRREWGEHGGARIAVWLTEETYEETEDGQAEGRPEPLAGRNMRPAGAHGKGLRRDAAEPGGAGCERRAADH